MTSAYGSARFLRIMALSIPHRQREMRSYGLQFYLCAPSWHPIEDRIRTQVPDTRTRTQSLQIADGRSTTTYSYDNNGNLTSAGNGSATTTYTYDYANHLTAIFAGGSTTTFGYDAFGQRVYQIASTTATTTYPFKFFSIASTTKSSTNYATSTEYIFNGETLLATVDQAFKNGAATGTAALRYVHPDHLGSTNVVTDQNGSLVQTLDYYPYGATRISSKSKPNAMP